MFDPEYFSIENLIKPGLPPPSESIMRVSALLSDINVSQHAIANIRGVGVRSENESKLTHSESVMKLGFTEEQMEDAWNTVQENLNEVVKAFV